MRNECTIVSRAGGTGISFWAREGAAGEYHLTAAVRHQSDDATTDASEVYTVLARFLHDHGAVTVLERIYGSLVAREAILAVRKAALGTHKVPDQTPVTWIEGQPVSGVGLAGVQMVAVAPRYAQSAEVRPLTWEERVWGAGLRHGGVTHIFLSGLHGLPSPDATDAPRIEQARRMFDRASRCLQAFGCSWRDVIRTWIYIQDILDWYGEFNIARNEQFLKSGLLTERGPVHLPASTGIGGKNEFNASCIMDLVAVKGEDNNSVSVTALSSPVQSEAFSYKSAFSRGMCVRHRGALRVYVSGCASIGEHGESLHANDPRAQMERTLGNVAALLRIAGLDFGDVCEGTAFFRRPRDVTAFPAVARRLGAESLPLVCTVADICRPELLFELEALAVGADLQG